MQSMGQSKIFVHLNLLRPPERLEDHAILEILRTSPVNRPSHHTTTRNYEPKGRAFAERVDVAQLDPLLVHQFLF